MEHRSQTLAARLRTGLLTGLCCWTASLAAQDVELPPETRARLEQGLAMQEQAAGLRAEADAMKLREDAACAGKFFVNDCRAGVQDRYLEQIRRARSLEAEGSALERQARHEERELTRQQRAAEAATQARELPLRRQEQENLRQSRETERERRLADKEAKAREGAQAQAERRRRQEEKQAEHARKVQERMDKARRQQEQGAPAGPDASRQP